MSTYMAEVAPAETDPEAMARAHHEGRLLLTEDKDFGELVFRWNWPVPGVVLLRIDPEKNLLKWARLKAVIETFGERIYGRYTVVETARFRSRPLHSPPAETWPERSAQGLRRAALPDASWRSTTHAPSRASTPSRRQVSLSMLCHPI